MGDNPQELVENTKNTMGPTLLGVHPSLSLDSTLDGINVLNNHQNQQELGYVEDDDFVADST